MGENFYGTSFYNPPDTNSAINLRKQFQEYFPIARKMRILLAHEDSDYSFNRFINLYIKLFRELIEITYNAFILEFPEEQRSLS